MYVRDSITMTRTTLQLCTNNQHVANHTRAFHLETQTGRITARHIPSEAKRVELNPMLPWIIPDEHKHGVSCDGTTLALRRFPIEQDLTPQSNPTEMDLDQLEDAASVGEFFHLSPAREGVLGRPHDRCISPWKLEAERLDPSSTLVKRARLLLWPGSDARHLFTGRETRHRVQPSGQSFHSRDPTETPAAYTLALPSSALPLDPLEPRRDKNIKRQDEKGQKAHRQGVAHRWKPSSASATNLNQIWFFEP